MAVRDAVRETPAPVVIPTRTTVLRRKLDADKITVVGMDGGHALEIQPLATRGHAVVGYRPIHPLIEQTIRHAEERDQDRRRAFRRMLRPREDLATLMLGTASVALAMVMSIVTLMGLRGISFRPWSVPRDVMVEAKPPRFTDVYDPVSRRYAGVPDVVSSEYLFLEWKSGDYTIRHMKPKYYVLKK